MMGFGACILCSMPIVAQNIKNNPTSNHGNAFEQLGTILPTPNSYRTASGDVGPNYWQQRADYDITCNLDQKKLVLNGEEKITYFNNSPGSLSYLWLQLDENEHSSVNNANYQDPSHISKQNIMDANALAKMEESDADNGLGDHIISITDASGKPLHFVINKTMMRVDLPKDLPAKSQFVFHVKWDYKITDRMKEGGRGGYEYFPEDKNYLFTMAQWYPRLCVYSDFQGWQNHQFTGRGEFALTFGNFKVKMTVPANHIVTGTGTCQNYQDVLTAAQMKRWQQAQTAKEPVEVVTLAEAKANEVIDAGAKTKTWIFNADSVRDFAWTSSNKFVWDAMPTYVANKKIMCMSLYSKEAYNLYRKFSTKVVAHTIRSYSHFTIDYPYPVAQSIEASNGMEYPMICFNYGRTEKDGSYSEATKNGMLGVVIHEVGHNFFPMIVNSDERQWTWMDEGLNSFVEYLTEELYDNKFPTRKGGAYNIIDYMSLPKDQLEPIMTNSENIVQFGPNAYSKPATGLNILRETIMGRELFDFAFKTYAERWKFKHPTPADLFRTMEDASGEDLDWFWRGWFYDIAPCDISLDSVSAFKYDGTGKVAGRIKPSKSVDAPILPKYDDISKIRNREDKSIHFLTDQDTSLQDFYWKYDRGIIMYDSTVKVPETKYELEELTGEDKTDWKNKFIYELHFTNKGGLVMPVILKFNYADGTSEIKRIPAQIWRKNEKEFSKVFIFNKEVNSILLDPYRETADIDESNNTWPKISEPTKLELFKMKKEARGQSTGLNPMQAFKKS
ncbi:M1 family peptidase [Rhizosphaericola mali]|uniref:M1 family peptidase n=2 Tax=Rhizosphaericola mali TaxID=2545455 RepID=A0A5P2G5X4_9BACT|nr:M1 family peptidase [Rhizosphaericola mali]